MKHENGNTEIITEQGSDFLATVEKYKSDDHIFSGWITIAYLGATGLTVDSEEWAAFVELVKKIDAYIVDNGAEVV